MILLYGCHFIKEVFIHCGSDPQNAIIFKRANAAGVEWGVWGGRGREGHVEVLK